MTKSQRARTVVLIRELWDKRSVPHIPQQDLRDLSNEAIVDLLRFWRFKDLHWVDIEQDDSFAPHYSSERDAKQILPPKRSVYTPMPDSIVFKTAGGGHLTGRQFAKLSSKS